MATRERADQRYERGAGEVATIAGDYRCIPRHCWAAIIRSDPGGRPRRTPCPRTGHLRPETARCDLRRPGSCSRATPAGRLRKTGHARPEVGSRGRSCTAARSIENAPPSGARLRGVITRDRRRARRAGRDLHSRGRPRLQHLEGRRWPGPLNASSTPPTAATSRSRPARSTPQTRSTHYAS